MNAGRAFGEPPNIGVVRPPLSPLAMHKIILFALMCALWIFAGLFGRDPWKPQETDFVIFIAEQVGTLSALPPESLSSLPPSIYADWAVASAKFFSPILPLHEGARLINAILLALALMSIGLSAGGGRSGWMAVLLTVGMTGLLVRAHLLNLAVPAFFGAALAMLGALRLRQHALVGGIILGGAIGLLFTAASPAAAVFVGGGVLATLFRADWRRASIVAGLAVAAIFLLPFILLSQLPDNSERGQYILASLLPTNNWTAAEDLVRLAAWALFPALPIAAAALWRGRSALLTPPVFLCLMAVAAAALYFLFYGGNEEDLFLLMPPLAVFAAYGLQKLPDDYAAILDWFAVLVVGVCCVGGMWVMRLLLSTEWDFGGEWRQQFPLAVMTEWSLWQTTLAALITILWVGLAANFGRSNERAVLNWSCGLTVAWCVFNVLWMPIVDSGKSYRGMAAAVVAHSTSDCVAASRAVAKTAAQIYYFGVAAGNESCPYRLQHVDEIPPSQFEKIWRGGRYADEDYILYRRF
ncbi:MAG: hypothetical protein ACNYPH_08085 [Gammaproteobacteria bacterium WSBS_2016_MAG_OTU1]